MSATSSTGDDRDEVKQIIEEHEDLIEDVREIDGRTSKYAEQLLDYIKS